MSTPSPTLYDAWLGCVRDFGDGPRDGSGDWQVPGLGPDAASFTALLGVVAASADPATEPADGHVRCDHYWVTDGADMVGFLAVPLVKLGRTLDETSRLVRGVADGTTPLLGEVTSTVTATNAQLTRVDAITANAQQVTSNVAALSGIFAATLNALAPKAYEVVMNTAFNLFPDSAAAKGMKGRDEKPSSEQIAFAALMRGVQAASRCPGTHPGSSLALPFRTPKSAVTTVVGRPPNSRGATVL